MEFKHSSDLLQRKQNEMRSNDAAYIADKKAHDNLVLDIKQLEVIIEKNIQKIKLINFFNYLEKSIEHKL